MAGTGVSTRFSSHSVYSSTAHMGRHPNSPPAFQTVPPGTSNSALTPPFLSTTITVEWFGHMTRTAKLINTDQSYTDTYLGIFA